LLSGLGQKSEVGGLKPEVGDQKTATTATQAILPLQAPESRPLTSDRRPPLADFRLPNLFILEEPTIGLHMADVQRLVDVLQRLVDAGHSVIVIEHNLDLIAEADWVIDLGPEGGDAGGRIVAEGTPEMIARNKFSHTGRFLRSVLTKP
jgi:excinuclease ABC subunit A